MGCLILYFLKLLLEIRFYFAPNIVHKDLKNLKLFLKKLIEFEPSNRIDGQMLYLILYPFVIDCIL